MRLFTLPSAMKLSEKQFGNWDIAVRRNLFMPVNRSISESISRFKVSFLTSVVFTYPSVLIHSQRWSVFVSLFQTAHPVKLRNARRLIFQIPFDVIGETLCSLFFYATVPLHSVRILA